MSDITWTPTPRQSVALSTSADHILFGGSRGGGKSDAAIHWFLYEIFNCIHEILSGELSKEADVKHMEFIKKSTQEDSFKITESPSFYQTKESPALYGA